MRQGAWVCEVHGRRPVGERFGCTPCREGRPREVRRLINCWRDDCYALRWVDADGHVGACVRCDDPAYDYDVD